MNKLKLKSGREVELKELGLDERDDVIDSSKYTYQELILHNLLLLNVYVLG